MRALTLASSCVLLMGGAGEGVAFSGRAEAAGPSNQDYRATVLADQPMMYWRLGEAAGPVAYDETENHRDAAYKTFSGCERPCLTYGEPGALVGDPNTAISLFGPSSIDGSLDYVSWSPTFTQTGAFSVEAWIKPAEDWFTSTFVSTRNRNEYGFDVKLMSGNLVHLDVGDGTRWLTTGSAYAHYQSGQWLHVVVTASPTGARIFVNGVSIETFPFSGTPLLFDPSRELTVGVLSSSNHREEFIGGIDEVALYDHVLSPGRIRSHFAIGAAGGFVGGRLVDAGSGLPIGSGTVRAVQDGVQVARTETDPAGRYALGLYGGGTFTVEAQPYFYEPGQADVTIDKPGDHAKVNFTLPSPMAALTPRGLSVVVHAGEVQQRVLSLANPGTAPLSFEVQESAEPHRSWRAGATPAGSAQGSGRASLPSARIGGLGAGSPTSGGPSSPATPATRSKLVDVITSWPTVGVTHPFGVGYSGTVWISDEGGGGCGSMDGSVFASSRCVDHEFDLSGNPLQTVALPWPYSWAADMAYDSGRGLLCELNVGRDNGIYCFDPGTGEVTDQINRLELAWEADSPRALAYRPDDDTFYVGGYGTYLYHVTGLASPDPGEVLGQCVPPPGVSGLAWNPVAGVLWAVTNGASSQIHELDPDTCAVLATHPFPGGVHFDGAGADLDEAGNLWVVGQISDIAYLIDTGVPAFTDVAWLTEDPAEGELSPGEMVEIGVTIDATELPVGPHAARLWITTDTTRARLRSIPVKVLVVP